jgi:peptidoglycan/xylan/chitin deacetylase (PgdA/CDA1 family)
MKTLLFVLVAGAFAGSAVTMPEMLLGIVRRTSPGVIYSVETPLPLVALSIDDGPSDATPQVLAVLKEHEARATFFVIGQNVLDQPERVTNMLASGNEIAHHMMRDEASIRLSPVDFRNNFREMDFILRERGGSRLFRPGSGWYNERILQEARRKGYKVVLGSVYPFDAQIADPDFAARYVLEHTVPGAIVILHDGPERGRRTAEVLRRVLPELRRRGLQVVTVSELLEATQADSAHRPEH